mmetsp:Transcript_10236/g.26412  ORF Transcript_10236/g.26412 Transcript_10236/m.26412 type:complete len:304 (+) Transcript_10236:152-1063(+)
MPPAQGGVAKWSPRRQQPLDTEGDADDLPALPDDDAVEAPWERGAGDAPRHASAARSGADAAAGDDDGGSESSLPVQFPTKVLSAASPGKTLLSGPGGLVGCASSSSATPRQRHALGEGPIEPPPAVARLQEVGTDVAARRCTAANPFWEPSDNQRPALRESQPKEVGVGGSILHEVRNQSRFLLPTELLNHQSSAGPFGALKCLGDALHAVDAETELQMSDADLTMVHIQSWEQKLDWRSFLSEAVAARKAREIFRAFDAEADPPPFARPPTSGSSATPPSMHEDQPFGRCAAHFSRCRSGL